MSVKFITATELSSAESSKEKSLMNIGHVIDRLWAYTKLISGSHSRVVLSDEKKIMMCSCSSYGSEQTSAV